MIQDVVPAVAGTRPIPGEADDGLASGSTVTPGRIAPGRAGPARDSWRTGARPGESFGSRFGPDSFGSILPPVVHEFTAAWERGESPTAEAYLPRLDPDDAQGAVDLIYREFCLAESDGRSPDAEAYVARFPRHAEALRSLFRFHGACSPSLLARLMGPPPAGGRAPGDDGQPRLPRAGDSIGPYVLRRELGRGSFARVFLAEQVDLANRLVVVKIAARASREHWLMARARHAHIVEILSHNVADDGRFHLICMPFWGGATLADVLAAPGAASAPDGAGSCPSGGEGEGRGRTGRLRRRGQGRGPRTGADLLTALDAVGAPEYPSVRAARPARELLAPLPYDRAIAWVVARLAEALDHAAGRDVTHGDVKPSNILLSADGNPMLLDFNLAREGAPALDASGRPIDPGGTLAYMAPERLRALAMAGSGADSEVGPDPDDSAGWPPASDGEPAPPAAGLDDGSAVRAAHVADIYALGMVLIEALSGRPPSEAAVPAARGSDPAARPARLFSTARAYAAARERPARAIVGDFEAASGRPIAPALAAILERCLDPDPDRRYRRGLELAEDLDRWRTDRPLAYADEPFWRHAVPRWVRVRRRKIAVAAASILALALATTAMTLVGSNRLLLSDFVAMALAKLEQVWDDPESGAFLGIQRHASPHFWEAEDPEALLVARRALADYGIIDPVGVPGEGDWRARDDVRYLPQADREDLEAWLMERAYRFGLAMADRPAATHDWELALKVLDRLAEGRSIRAFATLRGRLAAQLGRPESPATSPVPTWLDEQLLGFAAECRSGLAGDAVPASPADQQRCHRAAIERALGHYERALTTRPGLFWAHYRAASACFGLGRTADAARHLEYCLQRRPDNATVRGELAACLVAIGQYPMALDHCDQAVERAPRFAELYRTRALARALSRQTGGLDDDLRHFEMLSRVLPSSWWGGDSAGPIRDAGPAGLVLPTLSEVPAGIARAGGRAEAIAARADDLDVRAHVAEALRQAGLHPLARAELDKILVIRPDHIFSRITRAELALQDGRFDEARSDLRAVLKHPRLDDYLREHPGTLNSLLVITRQYLAAGRVEDARSVVERARELAIQFRRELGKAHYHSGLVYAVLAASDADYIEPAAKQFYRAFVANLEFRDWYRNPNPWIDPVRPRIDAAMGRMEDPAAVRRRLLSRSSAGAKVAGR